MTSTQDTTTGPDRDTGLVVFLGLGHMNSAILAGYLAAGQDPETVRATVGSQESADRVSERFGIDVVSAEANPNANAEAVAAAGEGSVILVGTVPTKIAPTIAEIGEQLDPQAVVVSIAAGVSLQAMSDALPADKRATQPLIRTMPNLPLTVGLGVVGMARGAHTTDDQVAAASRVFEGSGRVFEVEEDQINLVGAIAGSGPGHVFHFTDLIAQAAVRLGMEEDTAQEMARLTVAGSGVMLAEDGAQAAQLRSEIMTPRGTTEASIRALDDNNLLDVITTALEANIARSEAIGRGE